MAKSLSQQQHALLSFFLTLGLILTIYFLIIVPVMNKSHALDENIDDTLFQLEKFQTLSNQRGQLTKTLDELKTAAKKNNDFLKSPNRTLAVADIQKYIKAIIQESGGDLTSIQNMASKDTENLEAIQLKVHMSGNIKAIKKMLYQVSIHKPILFLDNLVLQPTRARKTLVPTNIKFSFEVSAYLFEKQPS